MRAALESAGVKVVALTEAESKFGAVETRQKHGAAPTYSSITGKQSTEFVVTLPNFGDERAIADALTMAHSRCLS